MRHSHAGVAGRDIHIFHAARILADRISSISVLLGMDRYDIDKRTVCRNDNRACGYRMSIFGFHARRHSALNIDGARICEDATSVSPDRFDETLKIFERMELALT